MFNSNQIDWDDTVLPFQLDRSSIRGRVARLDGVLNHVLTRHDYPPEVSALVAEVALLAALIGPMVKLRWKLGLQVRGKGPIRTIAADYYAPAAKGEAAHIRAWASFDAERIEQGVTPFDQIGEGYFAILIDQGEGNIPYQGITPLAGGSFSACAQTFFAQSEQLPTRFSLSYGQSRLHGGTEGWRAGGVMLQTLPASASALQDAMSEGGMIEAADILHGTQSEDWNRANTLLDTVEAMELIGPTVTITQLLVRLFHEETPRIFDPQQVKFGCSCSAERVRDTLSIYSAKDIAHMTTPENTVTADCQFCGAHYVFDPKSLGFEAVIAPDGNAIPLAQSA